MNTSDPLRNIPACTIAPPPRCYHRCGSLVGIVCGERAHWSRPGRHWFEVEYFCDAHRTELDVPIAAEHVFRRVRFECWVLFAGTHTHAPASHVEALARLERAVEAAGGLLDVQDTHSSFVKSLPQPPLRRAIGASGGV